MQYTSILDDCISILREWLDKRYPLDQRKIHPKIYRLKNKTKSVYLLSGSVIILTVPDISIFLHSS